MSEKCPNGFGHFSAFFELKNPNVDIWVPKMRLSKMYIFGAPIESEGPGMVSS